MDKVLEEVKKERLAQHNKWGEQNHHNGTSSDRFKELANCHRDITDVSTQDGTLTWLHILREEVYEAFAEEDPQKLREELVQIAAVAVAWIEAIDRR